MPRTAHPFGWASLSFACLSAWLVLLFSGWVGHGAVHLLFLAALALFPWRALGDPPKQRSDDGASPPEDDDT